MTIRLFFYLPFFLLKSLPSFVFNDEKKTHQSFKRAAVSAGRRRRIGCRCILVYKSWSFVVAHPSEPVPFVAIRLFFSISLSWPFWDRVSCVRSSAGARPFLLCKCYLAFFPINTNSARIYPHTDTKGKKILFSFPSFYSFHNKF